MSEETFPTHGNPLRWREEAACWHERWAEWYSTEAAKRRNASTAYMDEARTHTRMAADLRNGADPVHLQEESPR